MKKNRSPKILHLKLRLIARERAKVIVCVILALVALAGWKAEAFFMAWWVPAAISIALAIDIVSFRICGGWERWFEEPPVR